MVGSEWDRMEGAAIRCSSFAIRYSFLQFALGSFASSAWTGRRAVISICDTHTGRQIVLTKPRFALAFAGLICIALASPPHSARAVTAEVAKKCSALTAKIFPPRVIGNPGAGSTKGNGLAEQAYFKKCVASGGKVEDDDPHE